MFRGELPVITTVATTVRGDSSSSRPNSQFDTRALNLLLL
jgi:hypothetical protein